MDDGRERGVRLHSWKEIAAHLRRDVTTVRRWEKREGLPVHRHLHERRESVYADSAEIDRWWQGRRSRLAHNGLASRLRPTLPWALAATFLLTTVVLVGVILVRAPGDGDRLGELRFAISPPPSFSFTSASLSPDGRQLAYAAGPVDGDAGSTHLWIRPLDTTEAHRVPETEGAAFPFWSPRGDAVGFFAAGKLWTVNLAGGTPRALADAPVPRGGTWNADDVVVFAPGRLGPLYRVSAHGGAATATTAVGRPNERGHVWPEFLPDGVHFLFLADSHAAEHHSLFVGALDSTTRTPIIPGALSNAVYANGHVLLGRDRGLIAQPFDPTTLTLMGDPVVLSDNVHQPLGLDHKGDFSMSATGVVLYRHRQSPATRLDWRSRTGQLIPFVSSPGEHTEPAVSPDGTRVAVALFDPRPSNRFGFGSSKVRSDLWLLDTSTGAETQFTTDPGADWGAVWSPDGQSIVFSSNRRGPLELFLKDASGSTVETPLVTEGRNPVAQSWSPDGKFVLYTAFNPPSDTNLWLLPMTGNRTPVPLLATGFNEEQGQISPDGRWFAYSSDETGQEEVYVRTFPGAQSTVRVSTAGGGDPRWSRDGRTLYYIALDRQLMSVPIRSGVTFEPGRAAALFDTGVPPHWYDARNLYDVMPDGRFLLIRPLEDDRAAPFTIVLHPKSTSTVSRGTWAIWRAQ